MYKGFSFYSESGGIEEQAGKTVIVLGIRSGTSMISEMLIKLGVDMGKEFQGGDKFNEHGYFENTRLLTAISQFVGNRFTAEPIRSADLSKLKELKDKFKEHASYPIWGFKTPGATYALDAIDLFVDDPHYIVCNRNYREVGKSLEGMLGRHDVPQGFDPIKWAKKHLETMNEETLHRKRLVLEYDEVIEDGYGTAKKIADFLGIEVTDYIVWEAGLSADKKLKHQGH